MKGYGLGGEAIEQSTAPERGARLIRVADVPPETIDWIWATRLARGKMTLLAGDPGTGKTYLALAVAAALTSGTALPGETMGRDPMDVLYLTREDGVGDTIRPRLDALGADVSKVHVLMGAIDGGAVGLADVDVLGDALTKTGAALMVVDPIQSWLGARVDAHRANETRPVLDALGALCARHRCAAGLIAHTAKARGGRAVAAALGSIDFAGAARVMLIAGAHPQDRTQSILAGAKSNIGSKPESLAYRVDRETGGFSWVGVSEVTAEDVLAADTATNEDRSALSDARDFLTEVLTGGPRPTRDVEREARGAGISETTLKRARRTLGIRSRKRDFSGEWTLELPKGAKGAKEMFDPLGSELTPLGGDPPSDRIEL